jgi:uncharacterized membrane protein YqgA involved in biofilm formation
MVTNKNSTDKGVWAFNRQINLSVLIQLVLLAGLIVGTWVNLQNRLVLLQRDVNMLLESNENFQEKLESLAEQSTVCEYRITALEQRL